MVVLPGARGAPLDRLGPQSGLGRKLASAIVT